MEKVLLETLPGYYLGGNLYRPVGQTTKLPAVLNPHGHWKNGRREQTNLCSVPARCANLARQGYIAFAYDMVGYNDTSQTPHRFDGQQEQLWSFTPLGLQLWNSIRAADFLLSLPEVDGKRLAATGASGGGTQTFLLTAVDDRVRYSAPVNMVSAYMQGGCVCENAAGLRLGTFNVEIAAMMAPRPMLLVSATGDWTKNVPREEFPALKRIYELYGKPDNTGVVQIDEKHNYNRESREAVYRFFARHVLKRADAESLREEPVREFRDEELLALSGRSLPPGALSYEQILGQWKKMAREQNAMVKKDADRRRRLAGALETSWPERVLSFIEGDRIILSRDGQGDRVPGVWTEGKGRPSLVVHPAGALAGRQSEAVKHLLAAGRPVLTIDAFQTGAAVSPRDNMPKHYLTFQPSDDARRVQDILTALKFLEDKKAGAVELIGLERAGVWTLFAAAVAPRAVRLRADLSGFAGEDQDFVQQFFVPGIQRAGGLEAALALTAKMRQR